MRRDKYFLSLPFVHARCSFLRVVSVEGASKESLRDLVFFLFLSSPSVDDRTAGTRVSTCSASLHSTTPDLNPATGFGSPYPTPEISVEQTPRTAESGSTKKKPPCHALSAKQRLLPWGSGVPPPLVICRILDRGTPSYDFTGSFDATKICLGCPAVRRRSCLTACLIGCTYGNSSGEGGSEMSQGIDGRINR